MRHQQHSRGGSRNGFPHHQGVDGLLILVGANNYTTPPWHITSEALSCGLAEDRARRYCMRHCGCHCLMCISGCRYYWTLLDNHGATRGSFPRPDANQRPILSREPSSNSPPPHPQVTGSQRCDKLSLTIQKLLSLMHGIPLMCDAQVGGAIGTCQHCQPKKV